jgi:hypothetical protein
MEFTLVLFEDPDLVATDEQRKKAVERVGEYAMGLLSDGTLRGGAPLYPVTEASGAAPGRGSGGCRTGRSPRPRRSSPASRPGGHTPAVGSQDTKIRLRDVIGGAVPDAGTGLVRPVAGLGGDLRLALRSIWFRAGAAARCLAGV